MALAVDGSSPAAVVGSATTTTTASFSPPALSLLVAFVMADANNSSLDEACTVTSTGGLSWSLAKRENGADGTPSTVEIWSAAAVTAPGSITVSVTDNKGAVAKRLLVQVYTDSGNGIPAGIGAVAGNATSGNVSYTSTKANSWGWGVWLGGGTTPAAGSGQTLADSDGSFDGGDTTVVVKQNATTATPGTTVTMSLTGDTGDAHFAAAEVLPAAAAAGSVGAALPGRTWLRRFHHRQAPPQFTPAAVIAAAVPVPLMRPALTSRAPGRARIGRLGLCAAGIASQIVTPLGAAQPTRPPQPVTPHVAARAVIGPQGTCGAGIASQVVTPRGSMPSPMPRPVIQHLPPNRAVLGPASLPAAGIASAIITPRGTPGPGWRAQPRRPGPARALWHGNAGPAAAVITPVPRPLPQPRSPAPRRAVWHGNASKVVTPLGTPGPTWRPQPRRPGPGRALWRSNAGPAAVAAPAAQAYQHPQPQPRSPAPRRAVWRGFASKVVTPLGTQARRPGPQIASRPRSRAVWHGGAGTLPPVVTPPPPSKPLPPRRRPQRAVVRRGVGLVNALPPAFQVARSTPTVADPRDGTATVTQKVT